MLVSEVMLIQTQVSRVAVRFQPFIARFDTSKRCANAELSSVLREWSGLGYNRRAKSLHDAARSIESQFSGRVPSSLGDLASLDGVGPYVSRAVAAFAFAEHVAPIDSNVRRVFERALAGESLSLSRAQKIGDALIPRGKAREWGLALMDFGSLVCTARAELPRLPGSGAPRLRVAQVNRRHSGRCGRSSDTGAPHARNIWRVKSRHSRKAHARGMRGADFGGRSRGVRKHSGRRRPRARNAVSISRRGSARNRRAWGIPSSLISPIVTLVRRPQTARGRRPSDVFRQRSPWRRSPNPP